VQNKGHELSRSDLTEIKWDELVLVKCLRQIQFYREHSVSYLYLLFVSNLSVRTLLDLPFILQVQYAEYETRIRMIAYDK